MNPYVIIGALLVWGASMAGASWVGYDYGEKTVKAAELREQVIAQIAIDAMTNAAAKAISQIKVRNTTIKQETDHEIETHTYYAECKHSPEQLQRINEALTGRPADTPASGVVPSTGPAL